MESCGSHENLSEVLWENRIYGTALFLRNVFSQLQPTIESHYVERGVCEGFVDFANLALCREHLEFSISSILASVCPPSGLISACLLGSCQLVVATLERSADVRFKTEYKLCDPALWPNLVAGRVHGTYSTQLKGED